MDRRQQHAGRADDPPIQRQFAHGHVIGRLFRVDHPHRRQQRQRDRQVIVRPFLGQVGGGKVDGDPLGRQRQSQRGQRRLHPLAAFAHCLVGQADEVEAGHAGRDLALHFHAARLKPEIGNRRYQRDHACPPIRKSAAVMPRCQPLVEG